MLVLATQRGSDISVTYTSSTHFTQESTVPASSLQTGTLVRVTVTSSGGTYTATSIIVTGGTGSGFPGTNGTPGAGFGRGNSSCFARNRSGSGNNSFRGLIGTVGSLSGNTLTITDSTGTDYTVTITARTQLVQTKSVTAAALKVGEPLTVSGKAAAQQGITANAIVILLSLPKRIAPAATGK
jgi:hypothetical protein